jgi:hypothetical protein
MWYLVSPTFFTSCFYYHFAFFDNKFNILKLRWKIFFIDMALDVLHIMLKNFLLITRTWELYLLPRSLLYQPKELGRIIFYRYILINVWPAPAIQWIFVIHDNLNFKMCTYLQ